MLLPLASPSSSPATGSSFPAATACGRAWSGLAPVDRVEVSTDGGGSWAPARLEPQPSPWAWAGWSFDWDAAPGSYELCSRATDAAGNTQPAEAPWNTGGYANNALHRVAVTVRDPAS